MHQLVLLEYMEPLSVGLEELIGGISSSRASKKKVQKVKASLQENSESTDARIYSEEISELPKLKESESGPNDEAFESARKHTGGKFNVEHL